MGRAYLFMHFHVQPVGHLVILKEEKKRKRCIGRERGVKRRRDACAGEEACWIQALNATIRGACEIFSLVNLLSRPRARLTIYNE